MIIEHLKIKGFKSFGSTYDFDFIGKKQSTISGFTAIVGPNGSGKSNILDALRYVLGESSSIRLRISRLSDLLFQGSASLSASKETEVTLVFCSENTEDNINNDKKTRTAIKRRYDSEAGSVYYIDGIRAKLQDVEDIKQLSSLSGEDLAFIGQGDVADVIHQRPMQRRTRLEVLFGIDRYRKRREDTANKLKLSESEMLRIETLIQELTARRDEIAPEVAIAIEAQNIIENLEYLRRDYYFSKRKSLEIKISDTLVLITIHAEQSDILKNWLNMWEYFSANTEKQHEVIIQQEQNLSFEEKKLIEKKDHISRSCFSSASNIRSINNRISSIDSESRQADIIKENTIQDLGVAVVEKNKLESFLSDKRNELDLMLEKMESGKEEIQKARLKRQNIQNEIARNELTRSQLESKKKALEESNYEAEKLPLIKEKELLEDYRKTASNNAAEFEKLEKSTSDSFAKAFADARKYAAAFNNIRREISEIEANIEHLKEVSESEYPPPERMLLSASRLNKISAKIEIVTEVFSCEPKAASAIEIFLGRRRFYLLVNTMQEAQEGINHLKSRGGGRATFLPLERARPRYADVQFDRKHFQNRKGIVGWAIDLITIKHPWESVLRHLLGDLLVIEEYELGTEFVKKGASFPIVTVEGDIFAPTGTISGGSIRQSRGAISQRTAIQKFEEELAARQKQILEIKEKLSKYESLESKLQGEKTGISGELSAAREQLINTERRLLNVNSTLARIESEHSTAIKDLKTITSSLTALSEESVILQERFAEFGEIPDDKGESPTLLNLQAEISLSLEKLRSSNELINRIEQEKQASETRLKQMNIELNELKEQRKEEHSRLNSWGKEYYSIWLNLKTVQGKIYKSNEDNKRFFQRVKKAKQRLDNAELRLKTNSDKTAAFEEKVRLMRSEITQLNELWEEKYPYDKALADKIEMEKDLISTMRKLERELKALGAYNLGALSEDESLLERTDYLTEQLEDARAARDELTALIEETDKMVENLFTTALSNIDKKFNELFHRLFGGGEARLQIQEGDNIWERGVEIYARPPGKQLHNITQLSGGEQSLTAIAHLFASLEVAGTPLAVLDEVDAALDEYNLIRFASLAKEYSKTIQIIVMTHRRTTMEQADIIFGVTMVEPGLSRIIGINTEDYK